MSVCAQEPAGNIPVTWTYRAGTISITKLHRPNDQPGKSSYDCNRLYQTRTAHE
jgi:hypothetical protein